MEDWEREIFGENEGSSLEESTALDLVESSDVDVRNESAEIYRQGLVKRIDVRDGKILGSVEGEQVEVDLQNETRACTCRNNSTGPCRHEVATTLMYFQLRHGFEAERAFRAYFPDANSQAFVDFTNAVKLLKKLPQEVSKELWKKYGPPGREFPSLIR